MRKVLGLILAVLLMIPSAAFATTSVTLLKDSSGTSIENYSMTNGVNVASAAIRTQDNAGFMNLFVVEDKAGGTGNVDIYMEYSLDGQNWYRPYISNMAGTITVEGNVVTALQNLTRFIVLTPRLAPFTRVIFDPGANSEVTAYLIYLRE